MVADLTQEIVRELLDYCPETGDLFWRARGIHWFPTDSKKSQEHLMNQWNSRLAGKPAFTATTNNGYKVGAIKDTNYLAHRIIWLWLFGYWPNEVDHLNGKRGDNSLANLKEVTRAENQRNKAMLTNNTSGFSGVYLDKRDGRYYGNVGMDGEKFSIKGAANPEEVYKRVLKKRQELGGFTERHGLIEP